MLHSTYLDKVICIKVNWNENNNTAAELLLFKIHPQTHTNPSVKQGFSRCPCDQEKKRRKEPLFAEWRANINRSTKASYIIILHPFKHDTNIQEVFNEKKKEVNNITAVLLLQQIPTSITSKIPCHTRLFKASL